MGVGGRGEGGILAVMGMVAGWLCSLRGTEPCSDHVCVALCKYSHENKVFA